MVKRLTSASVLALVMFAIVFGAFVSPAAAAAPDPSRETDTRTDGVIVPPGSELDLWRQGQLVRIQKLQTKLGFQGDTRSGQQYDLFLLRLSQLEGIRIRDFRMERVYVRHENMVNNRYQQGQGQGQAAAPGQAAQGQAQPAQPQPGQTQPAQPQQGQSGTGAGGAYGSAQDKGDMFGNGLRFGHFKANFGYGNCDQFADLRNPVFRSIARQNGVMYDEVYGRFCAGRVAVGDVRLGYWVARKSGVPADQIFGMHSSGMSWDSILTTYDLKFDGWMGDVRSNP